MSVTMSSEEVASFIASLDQIAARLEQPSASTALLGELRELNHHLKDIVTCLYLIRDSVAKHR